ILLKEIESEHGAPAEMVMKLIDLELAMTGLSRRTGILTKIETVLKQDWGTLEDINQRNTVPEMKNIYHDKLADLKQRYERIKSNDFRVIKSN
ncbi:hypothetical protein BMR09_11985, partial [Methylococcaceae bacterium CS3]